MSDTLSAFEQAQAGTSDVLVHPGHPTIATPAMGHLQRKAGIWVTMASCL